MPVLSLTYKINVFIYLQMQLLKVIVMHLYVSLIVKRWQQNLFIQIILSRKCVAGVCLQEM